MNILLGADPEVFVRRGGLPFSAYGMIAGTKIAPFKVDKGAVQVDGNALEFNIDPAEDEQQFVHNIETVLNRLQSMIPRDCHIDIVPSIEFDWDHLKSLPPEALELGCDPDYNAWTGDPNPRPNGETNLRTASGHVHIGWGKGFDTQSPEHNRDCHAIVKQLDFFLGIPSVLLDKDTKRRSLYGCAGAYRPKPYGAEYRVLSNFWLTRPELTQWVYRQTRLAVEHLMNGRNVCEMTNGYNAGKIINTSDKAALEAFKKEYPPVWGMIDTFSNMVE